MPRKIELSYIVFAALTAGYAVISAALGEVISFQRAGSEAISVLDDPERFWGTVLVYTGLALIAAILGVKSYFHPKIYNFLSFGFESKLSWQQVIFVLCLAVAMYSGIFWLSGVLANA
ncbi:hypothetical protein [Microbulbifer taiwanensis]|uniref:Uncharacterized protein n=1 Tax=Microbulbifer taiwanensis TaxID=986746 RepID=A0ABW1YPU7_9GAMM|nr:hypothetical protein [Microbulbifer taiwanensis]